MATQPSLYQNVTAQFNRAADLMGLDPDVRWLQNKRSETWELDEVDTKLHKRMVGAYPRVRDAAKEFHGLDWRTAAYIIALRRLEKVYKERGIFP